MLYAASILVSFIAVFLKGFQHKNVIGTHLRAVFITSYLMAAFDVLAVNIVVIGGWWVALTAGIGASCGMVTAILLHDKIFARNR